MKKEILHFFSCLILTIVALQVRAQTPHVKAMIREIDSLSLLLKSQTNSDTAQIRILNRIAEIYAYRLTDYSQAEKYELEAIKLAEKNGNKILISTELRKMGNIYYLGWVYEKAVEYYLSALKVSEEANDTINTAHSLNNLGNVYTHLAEISNPEINYDKAIEYHLQALKLREYDNKNKVHSLLNIHNAYRGLKQYSKAIDYLEKANTIYTEKKDKNGLDLTKTSMGELYLSWAKETNKAEYLALAEKNLKERPSNNNTSIRSASALVLLGEIRFLQKRSDEAIKFLQSGMEMAQSLKQLETIKNASLLLSKVYKEREQYEEALDYYKLYRKCKDSLLNEKSSNQITELNTKYETKKKEKNIELLTKDKALQQTDMNKERLIINSFIGVLIIVLLVALILYNRFYIKKKLNAQLDSANSLLIQKNQLIETQKENILSSIDYAKLMQQVIILQEQDIRHLLPNSFLFYQPKDIVSGDFYWCAKVKDKIIIAVIDCTGHGVPGAFMSIIANTLLNQIVKQKLITKPSEILSQLNQAVFTALHQNKEKSLSDDGLDISLCCIDYKSKTLEYAGAQQPLYFITNGELKIIKADIYTIGGGNFPSKKGDPKSISYTNHTIPLSENMTFYLFTDGYTDQFGGPERRKFGSSSFQKLLMNNKEKTLEEQQTSIAKTHENWKEKIPQTDDILVIGVVI